MSEQSSIINPTDDGQQQQQIVTPEEQREAMSRMSGLTKFRVQRPKTFVPVEDVLDPDQAYALISISSQFTTCKSEAPQFRVCGLFPTAEEARDYLDDVFPIKRNRNNRDCDWVIHKTGAPLVICRHFENQTNNDYIQKAYKERMEIYTKELIDSRRQFEENLEQKKEGDIKNSTLEAKRRIQVQKQLEKSKKSTRITARKQIAQRNGKYGTKPIPLEYRNPNNAVVCFSVVFDYTEQGQIYPEPIVFIWISFPAPEPGQTTSMFDNWFQESGKNAIVDLEIYPVKGYEWIPITVVDISKIKKVYRDSFVDQIVKAREEEDRKAKNYKQTCKINNLKMKTTTFDVEKMDDGKVVGTVKKQVKDYESKTKIEYSDEVEEEQRKTEIQGFTEKLMNV